MLISLATNLRHRAAGIDRSESSPPGAGTNARRGGSHRAVYCGFSPSPGFEALPESVLFGVVPNAPDVSPDPGVSDDP